MKGKIVKLLPKGYGFVESTDKVEYWFHASACGFRVFDRLRVGMSVTFEELKDERKKGPTPTAMLLEVEGLPASVYQVERRQEKERPGKRWHHGRGKDGRRGR